MTITHNNALDFPGGNIEVRQRFNLTRTKFIFTLLKRDGTTQNVGGELIDVGMSHRLEDRIEYFFKHLSDHLMTYTLRFGDCVVDFKAYTLLYLTHDLEHILFHQRYFPWDDPKYAKRLNRLFYLYFVNIFVQLESGLERLVVLRDIYAMLKQLKDACKSATLNVQLANEALDEFAAKNSALGLNFNSLVERMRLLLPKVASEENVQGLAEMMQTLLTNADFVIGAIRKIRKYCTIEGHVTATALGRVNIRDIV
jgi:hypothetical protein